MFEGLTNSFQNVFRRLAGKAKISPRNIEQALQDVKFALLQSDVHFSVAKELINQIKEKAVGEEVIKGINPDQAFIKIVNDELISILGPIDHSIPQADPPPTIIMLTGLQGSGKTTTTAKLAKHLKEKGKKVMMVAADLARPAAIDQLVTLGIENDIPVFSIKDSDSSVKVAVEGIKNAKDNFFDTVLVDTQGRLHIDESLMSELKEMKSKTKPHFTYLVLDSMTGQDAVNSAQKFKEQIGFDSVILTKLDGDAKGGAVLSVKYITGTPIHFVGTGEKITDLTEFHPERMASRILGFGDVVSLVEKAQTTIKQEDAEKLKDKMLGGEYNFNYFLEHLEMNAKMGN
ncbi:MAG: signal recognition particle protein [Planctomycetes bacterium]|nr:signal recognition particle protein [Planctomycetota bacterium]